MELTQVALIKEAQKWGIEVDLLEDCETDYILLSQGDKEVLFSESGTPFHELSYQTLYTVDNKQLCKRLFQKVNISTPKGIVFDDLDRQMVAINAFMRTGQLYVCKPLDGTEGKGVCMNIANIDDLRLAWNEWKHAYKYFMLEEQKDGGDLRIQVIGGKLVAACVREPAYVIGDGVTPLSVLVEQQHQKIQQQNPANKLELDRASYELLKQQQLTLTSIPTQGQKVQLKYVANMNQGAVSIDITDQIHPAYQTWVERLAETLPLSIFGLDVLTTDYKKAPTPDTAWALEINGQPYWYHHTFSERRTHNIAKLILEDVFDLNTTES